jgi:RimJ/RimL family protein N-acetyltransferase
VTARIDTERLVLRPLRVDDVDELVRLDADPEVMRYLTGGKPSSREQVEDRVRARIGYRWMAYERSECSTGAFVGWFALQPSSDMPDERELGYRLRRAMWGKGYATEGSLALIRLAFTTLAVRRVWACTMAVNVRSRRVMERCGMRYVRTFHLQWEDPIPGTAEGEVEYELLRDVWGYDAEVVSRTVDTHVAELRRKLEDDPAHPRYILTVRKAGYRLALH